MDRRGTSKRLLPLAVFALAATSCMGDAKSWFDDLFTSAPKPRPVDHLIEPDVDIAARDLFYGVGGKKLVPRTDVGYRFIEKDTNGFSPNFDIEDPSGRRWDAKFGREAKSEVAASRLLWAVGFYQPPVYHVSAWRIEGGPEAGPQPEARFRYEDPTWKGDGMWSWRENPFLGTRELNGLIVMNVLINNWDVKASNNKKYVREGQTPRRIYVVKDLGQSFGRSVSMFLGSQSNPNDFAQQGFIKKVEGDEVEFDFKPILLNPGVGEGIHVEDVLWTCRRLAQLSDAQLRDAFRAAGYADAEVTSFAAQLKRKIQEGLALEQRARS
jgi:hypothetical protein